MKYSNHIGIVAALALMACCFAPWVYIPAIDTTINGFYTPGTTYGFPGIMNVVVSFFAIICFAIPKLYAKRTNLFICAFNLAWTIRNFLLITKCEMGECPDKKWGIYAIVFLAVVMMAMSLFPKIELKQNNSSL